MKTPAFYAFVFGLSLSSCQTVKGPQSLAHPQPAVAHTAQSKTQAPVKKEEPKQNLFSKKQDREADKQIEKQAPKGASFFGQIWIRPGRSWFSNKKNHTLWLAQDDAQDDDSNALSYFTLKSMYHGVGVPAKKSGADQRIFKLVWRPYSGEGVPRKQQARPPVPPLEQVGTLP